MKKVRQRVAREKSRKPKAQKPKSLFLLRNHTANVIAIDLGAESCRVSLATHSKDSTKVRKVYSFPNAPISLDGHLYWDLSAIQDGVLRGIGLCAEQAGGPIASIGVDGWAVDYVRLNGDYEPIANPFCYRDSRTETRQAELWKRISAERIYTLTGIQHLRINTLYQLYADRLDAIPRAAKWLNVPEYILQFLGGSPVAEYSNATHTQMVVCGKREWSSEIFAAAGLDRTAAPEIVPAGTLLGKYSNKLSTGSELKNTVLIAPACHDTGSAVAGIPAEGDDWAFISSGTWSLIGTVLPKPCTSESAQVNNFSNEGGLGGQSRFLKNVNGMWILKECLRWWEERGVNWELNAIVEACGKLAAPRALLNVDDPALLLPGNMPERINSSLAENGGTLLPTNTGEDALHFANLIFHSLASRYREVLEQLASITSKKIKRIYIVGGGSRNHLLNKLIAERTGMEVIRGPVESSTIGNLAVQFAVLAGARDAKTGVLPQAVTACSRRLSRAVAE
jgi:rhamnulokinase